MAAAAPVCAVLPTCEQFPSIVHQTDSYWLQTSSNEVASSHLFPPLDGSGSSQLSDRGHGVIRSCENRVIPGEKSKKPGLCSSLLQGPPCGIWHTLGQPDFLKLPCRIRIRVWALELLRFVYFILSCTIISWMEEAWVQFDVEWWITACLPSHAIICPYCTAQTSDLNAWMLFPMLLPISPLELLQLVTFINLEHFILVMKLGILPSPCRALIEDNCSFTPACPLLGKVNFTNAWHGLMPYFTSLIRIMARHKFWVILILWDRL